MKRIIISVLALLFILISCKKKNNDDTTPVVPKKTYKITYEIGCTDCEVVYYRDSLEVQSTELHQNSTWTYTFYGKKGQTALLFAYNTSNNPQGVTATIKVNEVITTTQTNYCPISGYAFVADTIE
jgi:hypothetical protein